VAVDGARKGLYARKVPKLPAARLALWAYAGAGIALGARAVAGSAAPLAPTLLGFGGYVLLGTLGVFWPERGMYGRLLWQGPARAEGALTFDDGPSPLTTPRVLELLAAAGVRATFFVVGRKAQQHPELVRAIAAAGHEVQLHGFEHDRLFSLRLSQHVASDIRRTQDVIERAGVPRPSLFRPPIGFVSHFTVHGAERANVTLIGCSARALDGFRGASADKVAERLTRALRPGALLAMHDAAERDDYVPASIEALPRVLAAARERGLRPVTLSEWQGA
jgi:peptidoglycan/xylan/chitin deacetylase (PgdA/CDA1 family)